MGAVVLGAAGLPAPVPTAGPAPASAVVERSTSTSTPTSTAASAAGATPAGVVLQVRAEGAGTARVGAPGTVAGTAAQASAASVVPPGLTGPAGSTGPLGVPDRVLQAYRSAEAWLADRHPGCALPWWLLAGIGEVESGHASGGRVDADGRTRGRVLGPLLDGTLAGTMVVLDTDGGAVDGDPAFDRAVGPMQFLPGTWDMVGTDSDGDGTADPHDVDDAAATAGVYLCRGGASMLVPEQLQAAVLRYNGSQEYVDAVLAWGTSYRDRAVAVPGQAGAIAPPTAPPPVPTPPPAPTTRPTTSPTRPPEPPVPSPTGTPAPSPTSSPTSPPTSSPTSSPTQDPGPGATTGPTAAPSPEPTGAGPTP